MDAARIRPIALAQTDHIDPRRGLPGRQQLYLDHGRRPQRELTRHYSAAQDVQQFHRRGVSLLQCN